MSIISVVKGLGYLVSTLSVILLGIVSWKSASEQPLLFVCLILGMLASVAGMSLRWISHRLEQKQKARDEVEMLREEYPNDPGVQFVRGIVARLDGDYDRALRSFDRMARLNPSDRVLASYNSGRIYMYEARYEDALHELDEGAAIEPEHPMIKVFRARVLYYRGEVDAAMRILQSVLQRHPQMDGMRPILAICLSAQGQHTRANEQLTHKVRQVAEADYDISYWLASAYLLQGRQVEALRWLETAIGLGNENVPWFESDPNWSDMHQDPRFMELMDNIKTRNREQTGDHAE